MKRKIPLIILASVIILSVFIWIVIPKMKQDKNQVIKTTIIDKNGNEVKPITEISGEIGK